MVIEIKVNNLAARTATLLAAITVCAVLTFMALVNCVVGVLTDQRVDVSKELLAAGIVYVPNSAALNSRLAEAEMGGEDRDISSVQSHALRAVEGSPWDYRQRLLLATVKEAAGDRGAAEQSLQEAVALAPNYTEVRWRLANLLLREGKLAKSVGEFRAANSANVALLPSTLDLVWRVSAGSLAAVQAVTPADPRSSLLLAQFLLKQSRASDAITVFGGIDRDSLVALPECSTFVNSLISEGRVEEARGLWVGIVSGVYAQPGHPLPGLWNGSFELDIWKNMAQFDWTFSSNEYAVPGIDPSIARTGGRSLRIDFTGRDTTRVDGQVKQLMVVRPGGHYRLECYVKTERLVTPEGPRVALMASSREIGTSDPVPAGSHDWRSIAVEFTTPADAHTVIVTIRRIPKFIYDDPTRGSVWFDDFVLTELTK